MALIATPGLACHRGPAALSDEATSTGEETGTTGSAATDENTAESGDSLGGPAECGNGRIEPREECDAGFANRDDGPCTTHCREARCGDGYLGLEEACDLGPDNGGPGCTEQCEDPTAIVWIDRLAGDAGSQDEARDVGTDATGRIYAAGWLTDNDGQSSWLRAYEPDGAPRYTVDWALDPCFPPHTTRLFVSAAGEAYVAINQCPAGVSIHKLTVDGERAWSMDLGDETEIDPIRAVLAFAANDTLVMAYNDDAGQKRLGWVEPGDPAIAQEVVIDDFIHRLAVDPRGSIIALNDENLLSYAPDGKLNWRQSVRSWSYDFALDVDATIVVARDAQEPELVGPRIERFDSDGTRIHSIPVQLDRVNSAVPVRMGGLAIDDSGNAILAVTLPATPGRPASDHDAGVLVLDPQFTPISQIRHPASARAADAAVDVVALPEGIAIAGYESVALAGHDAFVARIDVAKADRLEAIHPVQTGVTPAMRPTDQSLGLASVSPGQAQARPDTLFVNFLGEHLEPGENSARNESRCIEAPFDFPAYTGSAAKAEEALALARSLLDPFAVRIVTERPPDHLPYMLVMVGGWPSDFGLDDNIRGLACDVDCADEARRDMVFIFGEAAANAAELAQVIVHEAAHQWGLEHVLGDADLMHPINSENRTDIGDTCMPLSEPRVAVCTDAHQRFCPSVPVAQRARAELLATLGPSVDEDAPPQVEILSPLDGQTFVAGEPVLIEARITDDYPGFGWSFAVPELQWVAPAFTEQTQHELRFPPGSFTLQVIATDQAGQSETVEVNLNVHEDVVEPEPATSTDTGEVRDETTAPAVTSEDDDGGCSIPSRSSALQLAWLPICATQRPRRRRRHSTSVDR